MSGPNAELPGNDPGTHTAKVLHLLSELIDHLREDTAKFDEPKAPELFETGAEVPQGLRKAFEHYESGAEAATHE